MPLTLTDPAWPAEASFALDRATPLGGGLRGRRYARLQQPGPWGESLFLKLFPLNARNRRRARREVLLGQQMRRAGVPCPRPWGLYEGDGQLALLFEDLGTNAPYHHDRFLETPGALEQAARGIARMHGAGLFHRDLHLGNLLRGADGMPLVADFARGRLRGRLSERDRLRDLGRLVGSLLPASHATLDRFARAYLGQEDAGFCDQIEEAGYQRLRDHHANLDRRARRAIRGAHPLALRSERELVAGLVEAEDPDHAFDGPLLKEGSRSRVGRVRLADGSSAVLKHYLPRSGADPRDRLGFSKALRSLLAAEALLRRQLPAARPLAAWSRPGSGSWLLLEESTGFAPLQRVLPQLEGSARGELLAETARLARWMHRLGVAYRDFKPSNLLASAEAAPGHRLLLIDHDRNRFSRQPVPTALAMRDLAALHAGLTPEIRAAERVRALRTYDPGLLERPAWHESVRPLLREAAQRRHRWIPRILLGSPPRP